jgi:hypothetical protein
MLRLEYPEVKEVNGTMDDACDALELLGYTYLDSGRHARVFAKDDHVVKIGLVNEDNYFNYVRMIGLCSANPHLPHILSVDVYDMHPDTPESAPYYIVKMERLKVCFDTYDRQNWDEVLGIDSPRSLERNMIDFTTPRTDAMIEVKKILTHLYQCYDARGDLWAANVMWRGITAVFTDPVV